jgi:hypothetical protein
MFVMTIREEEVGAVPEEPICILDGEASSDNVDVMLER